MPDVNKLPVTDSSENNNEPEKTNLAEVENKNTLPSIENHQIGAFIAQKYLPEKRVKSIIAENERIDQLENTEIIEVRHELDNLPQGFRKIEYGLIAQGINPSLLTVEEAQKLSDYANNATPEIAEEKARAIHDTLMRTRNGVTHRRDWFFNPEKAVRFDYLADKYDRYMRGEIDTECGYDKEFCLYGYDGEKLDDDRSFDEARDSILSSGNYDPSPYESYSDRSYARLARDMDSPNSDRARLFENLDKEDLLEEGYISEDDLFVYGPYTNRDLQELENYKSPSWTNGPAYGELSRTAELLSETVHKNRDSVENDLLREYVAHEFLPSRRMNARNTVSSLAAIGLDYASTPKEDTSNTLAESIRNKLDSDLKWGTYYIAKLFDMRREDLKERYGSTRPTTQEFFKEALARSEALTDAQVEDFEKTRGPILAKLDEWLFRVEALYAPVAESQAAGFAEEISSEPDHLSLPGDVASTTKNLMEVENIDTD